MVQLVDEDLKEKSPGIVNSSCRLSGWIRSGLEGCIFPCSLFSIFEFIRFNRGLLYPPSWVIYLILPTWRKTISLKRSGPYVASSLSQVLSPWSPGSFLGGSTYSSGGGRKESFHLFCWKRKALLHGKEEHGRMETDACSHWGSNQGMIMPRLGIKGESRRKLGRSQTFPAKSRITPHPFLPSLSSRPPNSDS